MKRIYTLKESIIMKVNNLSSEKGLNKSEFVELAIDSYEDDFDVKLANIESEKTKLLSQISLLDTKKTTLTDLKQREEGLINSLSEQKKDFMLNIKRKMKQGDVIGAVEISKRVARLLKCPYLDLLPK